VVVIEINVGSRNPFHAVVAGDGDGLGRGIDLEVRPGSGLEWVSVDDGFVDFDSQAGGIRHDEVTLLDGERRLEDFIG
jgi:hypothetical protein